MMKMTGKNARFNYAETEDLQVLEMLYEGEELSMLVLLPKDDNVELLENSLTIENLNIWRDELRNEEVDIFMPKFTFRTSYTLNEYLKDIGINLAFSEKADFSGITGDQNLFINIILHKAFVDVNEEGTEAAAATGIGFSFKTSMPEPPKIFKADHPFIFIIQQKDNGNILFVGKINDPSQ